MMKKILIFIIYILALNTSFAFDNLVKGIGLFNETEEALLYQTSLPYAIARQGQRKINQKNIQAYIDMDTSVFSLSSGLDLIETKSSDRSLLGNWPVTRWSKEPIEKEVLDRFELVNRKYESNIALYRDKQLGCLNTTPLKYGDLESDGQNELILMLGNDLVVFSLITKQSIFMVKLRIDDWFTKAETSRHFELNPYEGGETVLPQYQTSTNIDYKEAIQGYRGYAKLYTGDFDEDGNADIVVWRKLYLSNFSDNPQIGFTKQRDTFYHYERKLDQSPEYLPVTTNETDIRQWLTSNSLTWQKGYPNLSECAGQTNQHIPEMVDPLLNDPDVLQ